MHLATYVHLLEEGSTTLAHSYQVLAEGHAEEPEVVAQANRFQPQCEEHARRLGPARQRYGDHPAPPPDRLHVPGLDEPRSGGLGLLRDLHQLYDVASHLDLAWTIVEKAAEGNRDEELREVAESCGGQVAAQLAWLTTQVKTASAQTLLVAE
jgi:hypothetical protein